MANISSAGIGSGLNVQSIISQLVAVESRPVQLLQQKGSTLQTKISAFAQIKADMASLQDAASGLMSTSTWSSKTFASTNASAVTGTATSSALASTFSLSIDKLASGQSTKSTEFPSDFKAATAGTLSIQLGTWNATGSTFSAASSAAVTVDVAAGDSLAAIATKINAKSTSAGVSATLVTANGAQQLLLRGTKTGAASGFQITPSTPELGQFGFNAFKQPYVAPATAGLNFQLDPSADFPGGLTFGITVTKGDSLSAVAATINANPPGAGIVASVLTAADGSQQLQVVDSTSTPMTFGVTDSSSSPYLFSQAAGTPLQRTKPAEDASITIDGVAVTSATNTVSDALPGVTLNLSATTTSAAQVTVGEDKDTMKAKIQAFQDAYNKLNADLKAQTKYDAASKTGGPLLGDSTVTGLHGMLRAILVSEVPSSISSVSSLSKLGLAIQSDGSLKTDSTKVDAALQNTANVKAFFANSSTDVKEKGIAKRLYDFVFGANAVGGTVSAHSAGFQKQVDQNNKAIDTLNTHLVDYQKQLAAQYTALDKNMAKLNSLSSYVSQQVTTWNKSG